MRLWEDVREHGYARGCVSALESVLAISLGYVCLSLWVDQEHQYVSPKFP